jgi:diguanylate cyclase (GGDEF)-like protein
VGARTIDLDTVIEFRNAVVALTELDFSVFDHTGFLLVPSASRDPIIEGLASSKNGKEEHQRYVQGVLEKVVLRKGPSFLKGPLNQHHSFIPVQLGPASLILMGKAFYTSLKDLDDFFASKGSSYGLSEEEMKFWIKRIYPKDIRKVSEVCGTIHRLFTILMEDNYEKNLNAERSRKMATIMELFSGIEKEMNEERIYGLLADAILFLFGGDTVSVMSRVHSTFVPVLTTGRLKKQVGAIPLAADSVLLSDTLKHHRPVARAEGIELLRLGYPDTVTSLHLFPLTVAEETLGFLGVFNSLLSENDIDAIAQLCSFGAFLLKVVISQKAFGRHINSLTAMNLALNLSPAFHDPDALYESIVDVSSKIMNAEKASLMLPEKSRRELHVKAVRGMNKWIAKNIRLRFGEGIAGKVFKEGRPLMISDIERNLSTSRRPNYRTGAFVSIPLKIGDETIGVLNIADKVTGEIFSEADMAFLRYFASYASIAIKGAQYYSLSEEMRTLSITDSLTGLFNRRYFDDRLFEELQRATRYDSVFSLAIFDIDDFKLFNDTEGHLAGDEVLKAIADIARESLRAIDILSRFGGEEFSIIMPQTDRDEAFLVAERVRKNIRDLLPVHWKDFPQEKITVSVGIAVFPVDGKDAKALIRNADKALYRAKISGKDRTVVGVSPDEENERTPFRNNTRF